MRSVSKFALNPLARLGLAAAAIGGGAYLGSREEVDTPETKTIAEADDFLRNLDTSRSLARMPELPMSPQVRRLPETAQKIPKALSLADANLIEGVLGEGIREADANAHMINPQLGANWMTLGK